MAWANGLKQLPDSETKLLLLVLANYANDTGTCFPGIQLLCHECVLSESTVRRRLDTLKAMHLIKITQRQGNSGGNSSNLYTLNLKAPPVSQTPPPCPRDTTPPVPQTPKPVHIEPVIEPMASPGVSEENEPANQPDLDSPEKTPIGASDDDYVPPKHPIKPGDHKRTIEMWVDAYQKWFKHPYRFDGARDGLAVKKMLEDGLTPEMIIEKAQQAWSTANVSRKEFWNCKNQSKTLHLFNFAYNKIVAEVQEEKDFRPW